MRVLIESTKSSSSTPLSPQHFPQHPHSILDYHRKISNAPPLPLGLCFSGRFGRGGCGDFLLERNCLVAAHAVSTSVQAACQAGSTVSSCNCLSRVSLVVFASATGCLSSFSITATASFLSPSLTCLDRFVPSHSAAYSA